MSEKCHRCLKEYDTVYRVSDELWSVIYGKSGAGLLCLECADYQARRFGYELFWEAGHKEFPAIASCSANAAEVERIREEKKALHEAYTIQLRLKESAEASLCGIEAGASDITYIVSLIQRHPDDSFGAARAISKFIKEGAG